MIPLRPPSPTLLRRVRAPVMAAWLAAAAAMAAGARPALARQAAPEPLSPASSASAIERSERLVSQGRAAEALRLLEGALEARPRDAELRWRAARAAVVAGMMAKEREAKNAFYRRGIEHADAGLAAAPDDPAVVRWAVATRGRLALHTGARETARLADEIWEMSHRALERTPDDAVVHFALGTLHQEVMELSAFERFLGRLFLGGAALSRANWEGALRHLGRAVELEPDNRLFRARLARALYAVGRTAEARTQIDTAVSGAPRDAVDAELLRRAREVDAWMRRADTARRDDGGQAGDAGASGAGPGG